MPAGTRGGKRFRRLLKGLADAERAEIVVGLNVGGRELRDAMRARSPRRTGATAAGISYKVYPVTLRMRVGLLGRRGRADFPFYGRIQDLGRKAQTVTVRRRSAGAIAGFGKRLSRGKKIAADVAVVYRLRVRAMAPKRFVTGRYGDLRRAIRDDMRGTWSRALKRISSGGDE